MKILPFILITFDGKGDEFAGSASIEDRGGVCNRKNKENAGQEH
jgi:hypothetical protein